MNVWDESVNNLKIGEIILCADYEDVKETIDMLADSGVTAVIEPKYVFAIRVTEIHRGKENEEKGA